MPTKAEIVAIVESFVGDGIETPKVRRFANHPESFSISWSEPSDAIAVGWSRMTAMVMHSNSQVRVTVMGGMSRFDIRV